MVNKDIALKWIQKYSNNDYGTFSTQTIAWYRSCSKMGRREFLRRSRKKTRLFEKRHPENRKFRVFKCLVLKNKTTNPLVIYNFKKLIEKNRSAKGAIKFRNLDAKELYSKMKEVLYAKCKQ